MTIPHEDSEECMRRAHRLSENELIRTHINHFHEESQQDLTGGTPKNSEESFIRVHHNNLEEFTLRVYKNLVEVI